ncbi:MAG: helix-turn-helix domain-containing protein [Pelagimonas sp.]
MLWAFEQKDLKPATKLILVFLADSHNGKTLRCDPRQDTIATKCNVGRATVNRHLSELEARGLIQRIRRANKQTQKQDSTLYRLGCDGPFRPLKDRYSDDASAGKPVSQNETREKAKPCLKGETRENKSRVSKTGKAVSQKTPEPCLNSETQTGKEPEKNLSRTQAQAGERTHTRRRAPAREGMFFTDDERHEAMQIAKAVKDGHRINPAGVPDRVAACLWVEGHLSATALRDVGIAEKGGCNG